MILYHPTNFHFNTMNSFKVIGCVHPPSPLVPGTLEKPGLDRVNIFPYL